MPKQPRTVLAWLIHGTWARRARWVHEGSPLRVALERDIPAKVSFELLSWSGNNSESARDEAAEKLVASAERTEDQQYLRVAVAHSHGGNIAAHAVCRRPDLFNAVVTLNTPFVALVPRDWTVIVLHSLILIAGVDVFVNWQLHLNFLLEAAIGLVCMAGVFGLLFIFRDKLMAAMQLYTSDVMQHDTTDERTRVLCISTADDEAFGWLELADALINAPFLLLHRIALPVIFVGIMIIHLVSHWDFSMGALELLNAADSAALQSQSFGEYAYHFVFGNPPQLILTIENRDLLTAALYNELPFPVIFVLTAISSFFYFSAFFAILATLSLIAGVVMRRIVFGTSIGLSAFMYALCTRLKVTLTPVYLKHAELRVVQSSKFGWLRHSDAYANPEVQSMITDWITSILDESNAVTKQHTQQPNKMSFAEAWMRAEHDKATDKTPKQN